MTSTNYVIKEAQDRLQAALSRKSSGITMCWNDGELVLNGRVPTFYQKQLAQEAVRHVDGVNFITNQIEVSSETVDHRV